jgi:hypothetical protein
MKETVTSEATLSPHCDGRGGLPLKSPHSSLWLAQQGVCHNLGQNCQWLWGEIVLAFPCSVWLMELAAVHSNVQDQLQDDRTLWIQKDREMLTLIPDQTTQSTIPRASSLWTTRHVRQEISISTSWSSASYHLPKWTQTEQLSEDPKPQNQVRMKDAMDTDVQIWQNQFWLEEWHIPPPERRCPVHSQSRNNVTISNYTKI